jgi:hypothetical protein
MRAFILFAIFAIAVIAFPIEISTGSHLSKRSASDDVLAEIVRAAIAFGLFLWGGGIIAKRGVNYYFQKLDEYEKERAKETLITTATAHPPEPKDPKGS